MKISKLGIVTGLNRVMKFTAIMLVLTLIINLIGLPITLKSMFLENIVYFLFVGLEFTLGYKAGYKIDAAKEGETVEQEGNSSNS